MTIKDFTKGNGTSSMWKHLANEHIEWWVSICNQEGIKITASTVQWQVEAYCTACGQPSEDSESKSGATRQKYSREAFVDAMVEWVVVDDQVQLFYFTTWLYTLTLTCQLLNVVDSTELHNIFLMLWQELRECDIPHCLTICRHAKELHQGHLQWLEDDMKVSTSESPSLAT